MTQGVAHIEMAMDPEVQLIVLKDSPGFSGDPSQWPSQNPCLEATKKIIAQLIGEGALGPLEIQASARLINGVVLNAALWVAASANAPAVLPRAIDALIWLTRGLQRPPG